MCNLEMPFSRSLNKSKQSGQKWQNSAITNAFTSGCMIISKAKINVFKKQNFYYSTGFFEAGPFEIFAKISYFSL